VASRTGVGAVIDGGIRDLQGLQQLEGGVNIFHRGVDPTPIRGVTVPRWSEDIETDFQQWRAERTR
jgi:regulator of RNase E activity RraA